MLHYTRVRIQKILTEAGCSQICRRVKEVNQSTALEQADPRLPMEVLMKIWEFSAQDSLKSTLTLSLVSSRARAAVFPFLLQTVTLSCHSTVMAFSQYLSSAIILPPRMPGGHKHHGLLVKSLRINLPEVRASERNESYEKYLANILMVCNGISTLALTSFCLYTLRSIRGKKNHDQAIHMEIITSAKHHGVGVFDNQEEAEDIQMTTVIHASFHSPTIWSSFFRSTTHLDLGIKLTSTDFLLAAFPNLTHLALRLISALVFLTTPIDILLMAAQHLKKVIVIVSPSEYGFFGYKGLSDWISYVQ